MLKTIYQNIAQVLNKQSSFLLVGHRSPDADALGAILSLSYFLNNQNKKVGIFTEAPITTQLNFLPGFESVKSDPAIFNDRWEVVIVLDSADLAYAGIDQLLPSGSIIINIDHHVSNVNFGNINLVDNQASSTCEILYNFFNYLGWVIDKKVATLLLAGLMLDTGGLSNSAASAESIRVAGELFNLGARLRQVVEMGAKNKSIDGLKLWGLVLSRLKINHRLDLAYTYVKDDDIKKFNINKEEVGGLANFLNVIGGVSIMMLIHISPLEIKVSLRTTKNNIDVAKIAGYFGGGGHKKAAGFTAPWQIEEIDGYLRVL